MIVESSGNATVKVSASAGASMIVSTTGTAYAKKGVVKTIIRFIKKVVKKIKEVFRVIKEVPCKFMATRSGKPSSIDPPSCNFT